MRYYEAMTVKLGKASVEAHLRYYILPNGNYGGDGVSTTTGEPIPLYIDLIEMTADSVGKNVPPRRRRRQCQGQDPALCRNRDQAHVSLPTLSTLRGHGRSQAGRECCLQLLLRLL